MSETNQLQVSDDEDWESLYKFLVSMPKTKLLNLRDNVDSLPESNSESWTRFQYDHPIEFAEKVLGIKPNRRQRELGIPWYTEDQKKFFDSVVENKRTLALSGNAVGKTFCMAIIALWLYHKGYMVITTAPTLEQLQDVLWGQMRDFRRQSRPGMGGHWLDVKCRASFGPKHFMTGFTVRTGSGDEIAVPAQGRHGALIAFLADEVVGIPYGILEAADVICVNNNAKIVGAGNPHDGEAPIKKVSEIEGLWNIVQISCENHPNVIFDEEVIPGATTRRMVQDQLDKCGGNRDAALFRSTVLGLWPGDNEESLIQEAWIDRAMKRGARSREDDFRGKSLGVDIAGEGGDLSGGVICDRAKIKFPKTKSGKSWVRGQDLQASVSLVHDILQCEPDIRVIGIDATGLGDGPATQLVKERDKFPTFSVIKKTAMTQADMMQRANVISIKFSHRPDSDIAAERFETLKDQMWWDLAQALRLDELDLPTEEEMRAIGLPKDSNLKDQLKRPIFFQNARGAIKVLDRKGAGGATEEVRKRARNLPVKSPDVAHMILLAWRAYSKYLKPGERIVKSMADIRAAEFAAIRAKEIAAYTASKKKHGMSRPWMRAR